MRPISKLPLAVPLLALMAGSLACTIGFSSAQSLPPPQATLGPPPPAAAEVILQRLQVDFLGADGHKLVGSGCPGTDGRGSIVDYHFVVQAVDTDRKVDRILVAGDNGTLTWQSPCTDSWGLLANDLGAGKWEVYIAPSLPSDLYTIIFFYDDNSFALGMTRATTFQ